MYMLFISNISLHGRRFLTFRYLFYITFLKYIYYKKLKQKIYSEDIVSALGFTRLTYNN